jgi:hypothetical protein
MLAALSRAEFPAVKELRTRSDDDFSIALLDAVAMVADVLTFYQERLANESFLRTATERRSLLELARLIGYELRPGVAASTYLAFTLEEAPGAPRQTVIDIGTRVQSVPGPGEKPQTFETIEKIEAHVGWNALRPRLTQPQPLSLDAESLYFAGTNSNLKSGDWLLIAVKSDGSTPETKAKRIQGIEVDQRLKRTRVDFSAQPAPLPSYQPATYSPGIIALKKKEFVATEVSAQVTNKSWKERDLNAFIRIQGWPATSSVQHIATRAAPTLPPADEGVFRFRERLGFFGHNAPAYASLPKPPHTNNWDGGNNPTTAVTKGTIPSIWKNSAAEDHAVADVFLERSVPEVTTDSWVLFQVSTDEPMPYRVSSIVESSLADYALSGRATGLLLKNVDGQTGATKDTKFKVRSTTAHVQSERLELADLPIEQAVAKGDASIELGRMILGFTIDQPVIIGGERSDLPGVIAHEVALLKEITHAGGFTSLTFREPLQFSYKRDTVTVNANVASATHGETVQEVLGGGDASEAYQSFNLRQPPLTYVSSANASGADSTLQLRVNDLLWHEVPTLYGHGPREQIYITRADNEGKTTVQFGNGVTGARLPSGQENVHAVHRKGIGMEGLVSAGQLSLLLTRPLSVKSVTNPLDATGAQDPEQLDEARHNAPLTVLTLDRTVSLQDYEDFARGFAGIAKALATWIWEGRSRAILVTVAGPSGAPVMPGNTTYDNLLAAMHAAGDPFVELRVKSYQVAYFRFAGRVKVDPNFEQDRVLAAIEQMVRARFSFEARAFGQPVMLSEVITAVQAVAGVVAVDLDKLYRIDGGEEKLEPRLLAAMPLATSNGDLAAAELLTLDPAPLELGVMT